jgi:hypothetical protein
VRPEPDPMFFSMRRLTLCDGKNTCSRAKWITERLQTHVLQLTSEAIGPSAGIAVYRASSMDVISIPLLIITIHPIGGRSNQTRDNQTTIKNDGTAGETGIRMPAVISLDQVSMIMVIRRGRIGLVGNGHREGWRRDVDLQLVEKKYFHGVSWLCTKSPVRNLTLRSIRTFRSHFDGF